MTDATKKLPLGPEKHAQFIKSVHEAVKAASDQSPRGQLVAAMVQVAKNGVGVPAELAVAHFEATAGDFADAWFTGKFQ